MAKKINLKRNIWTISIFLASLVTLSILISLLTTQTLLSSFRIVLGSFYVLFLPGFVLSYIFFPKTKEFDEKNEEKGTIDWIERIALSFTLSIAIVPLVMFYLNLIGIKINTLNSFLTILGILIISSLVLYYKNR
jgi:uncharacterized membrane protein